MINLLTQSIMKSSQSYKVLHFSLLLSIICVLLMDAGRKTRFLSSLRKMPTKGCLPTQIDVVFIPRLNLFLIYSCLSSEGDTFPKSLFYFYFLCSVT